MNFVGFMVENRNLDVGTAALQGLVCGLKGQTGIRPGRPPGFGLRSGAWLIHKLMIPIELVRKLVRSR
jgi:hypothetical protein